jgi:hypothetical protein
MIDFLTRYVSAISLAIATTLSLFNIGYFWKIGLHFLGLIDLSNLVYSLGVSLTVLSIGVLVTASVVRFGISTARQVTIALLGVAMSLWGIVHVNPRTLDPQFAENAAILVGFLLSGAAFASKVLSQPELANWRNLAFLALGWSTIAFQAGACQAAVELSDRFKYIVSTKSGVIDNARIMRASSSGFLLAVDGRITFIPHSEIKEVRSQAAN